MKHFRLFTAMLAMTMLVSACGSPGAGSPSATTAGSASASTDTVPDKLVLGFVPSVEAQTLVEDVKPLADFLSQELGIPVEGVVSNDYTGLVTAMETGQAHIAFLPPYGMVQAIDRAGADIILQSERFGSGTYHTQFFTNDPDKYCTDEPEENTRLVGDEEVTYLNCNGTARANDETPEGPVGLDALDNLEPGTTVAFVDQTSASGYIFPATILATAGMDPESDIKPLFTKGHDASAIAVCEDQAEVGVSFDDARPQATPKSECDVAGKVVVFAYGPEIPNDGVGVAGDLPDDLKADIKQALLDYADSDEGKEVLDSIYEITAFTDPNLGGLDLVRQAVDELGYQG